MADLTVRDPRIVSLRFVPVQLTRARELRAMTKTALSELVGKSPGAISQFESGLTRPDGTTLARISLALGVPLSFFVRQPRTQGLRLDECHFRSLRSAGQHRRRQAIRIGELVQEISYFLEDRGIVFPAERLNGIKGSVRSTEDIEERATAVRRHWGLGLGPLPDPMALLEAKGIRILPLVGACAQVDSFSAWYAGTPFIFLAVEKATSRVHYDAAHELGHLIMHEDVEPGSPEGERQAHRFGSAFLLPRDSFAPECPRRWNLQTFYALKRRWFVSVQAMVTRAHQLDILSISSYRRAFAELNRRNMRRAEHSEWTLKQPQVLRRAIEMTGGSASVKLLADEIGLSENHLLDALRPILADSRGIVAG